MYRAEAETSAVRSSGIRNTAACTIASRLYSAGEIRRIRYCWSHTKTVIWSIRDAPAAEALSRTVRLFAVCLFVTQSPIRATGLCRHFKTGKSVAHLRARNKTGNRGTGEPGHAHANKPLVPCQGIPYIQYRLNGRSIIDGHGVWTKMVAGEQSCWTERLPITLMLIFPFLCPL